MATSKPPPAPSSIDPLSFTTWSDAFAHPIPTVRTLETQLRKHITENNNKLRSLVGSSYRELLGTAERIIEMDTQMELAEEYMGSIGARCNAGIIELKAQGLAKLGNSRDEEKRRFLAKIRVLGCVLDQVGLCVKKRRGFGSEGIVAAKLLVLARLLYKSLNDEGYASDGEVLDELRKKMVMLRKKLLRYIDMVVRKPSAERDIVVDTLCAYALVTSSSPAEVLKYFLATRYERMQVYEDADARPTHNQVLELLDLYASTLADARAVFPRLFSQSMSGLQKVSLFQDPQITGLGSLNLDLYGRWIDESIRGFTPWVRQDQLSNSDVGKAVTSWAKQSQRWLVQAVESCIRDKVDIVSILAARTSVLQHFLPLLESSNKSYEESHVDAMHALRKAYLQRLEDATTITARAIEGQGLASSAASDDKAEHNIWVLASNSINVAAGGLQFRDAVMQRRHGRLADSYTALNEWVAQLDTVWEVVGSMRSAKWDTDEIDVEITEGDPLSVVLSKKDPEHLHHTLRNATTASLKAVYSQIEQSATSKSASPNTLLRHIREVNARRLHLSDRVATQTTYVPEGLVSSLQKQLSESILESQTLTNHAFRTARALWDGSPPLPVQPTTTTYKLLTKMQGSLAESGSDLWTREAVVVFKACLGSRLDEIFRQDIPTTGQLTNGDEKGDEPKQADASDDSHERTVQKLFDALYLRRLIGRAAFEGPISKLRDELKLEGNSYERLDKSAGEYWKRTYLLFGLLAA